MNNLTTARGHVDAACETASELGRQLARVHDDVLELEPVPERAMTGTVLADRADDLRRLLRGALQEQAQSIRPALVDAESAYFQAVMSGRIDPDHARTLMCIAMQAARETRFAQLAIATSAAALGSIAFWAVGQDQRDLVRRSIVEASSSLERARRSIHRVNEDLPLLGRVLALDSVELDDPEVPLTAAEVVTGCLDLGASEVPSPPALASPAVRAPAATGERSGSSTRGCDLRGLSTRPEERLDLLRQSPEARTSAPTGGLRHG